MLKFHAETALKVLLVCGAKYILLNGPDSPEKEELVRDIQEAELSCYSANGPQDQEWVEKVRRFLALPSQNSLVVNAFVPDPTVVSEIFRGPYAVFTHAYIFFNNSKGRALKKAQECRALNAELTTAEIRDEVQKILQEEKAVYSAHSEYFEEKILTILV